MLSGIYSLLSAGLFVTLDAVDVAFTEAAVGGGISTVLMLGVNDFLGWRIAMVATGIVLFIMGIVYYKFTQD